jgi:replicative DNA helicase
MATGLDAEAAGKRQSPSSLEAEQATLGAVLIKPSAFDDVAGLLAVDDFFFPQHREIFESMRTLIENGDPIDVIPLAEDLRRRGKLSMLDGQESYLLTLTGAVGTAENVGHYAAIVKERATARRVIAKCLETASRAYALEDVTDLVDDHVTYMSRIESAGDDDPVRVGDVIDDAMSTIETKNEHPNLFYVRSGLGIFDKKIGGYARDQLIVVAALPGGGKSSWAWDVAIKSAEQQGIPNLVFSMEMSKQELIERGLGALSMVETRKIHRGAVLPDDWIPIHSASKRLRPLPLYIYDKRTSIERVVAISRRWAAKVRKGMPPAADGLPPLVNVTIDYLQIAKRAQQRGQSEENAIANFTGEAKGLARDLKSPVTLISQLTKKAHDKSFEGEVQKPSKEHLKGSGAIEADADVIIMPFSEPMKPIATVRGVEPDPKEVRERLRLKSLLIIPKNRAGATGELPCIYDKATMTFSDDHAADDFDSVWAGDSRLPRDD